MNDAVHRVVLEHGLTSGKRKIMVDGAVEYSGKQPMNRASSHNFFLEAHPMRVVIHKRGSHFGYELFIRDEAFESLKLHALGLR